VTDQAILASPGLTATMILSRPSPLPPSLGMYSAPLSPPSARLGQPWTRSRRATIGGTPSPSASYADSLQTALQIAILQQSGRRASHGDSPQEGHPQVHRLQNSFMPPSRRASIGTPTPSASHHGDSPQTSFVTRRASTKVTPSASYGDSPQTTFLPSPKASIGTTSPSASYGDSTQTSFVPSRREMTGPETPSASHGDSPQTSFVTRRVSSKATPSVGPNAKIMTVAELARSVVPLGFASPGQSSRASLPSSAVRHLQMAPASGGSVRGLPGTRTMLPGTGIMLSGTGSGNYSGPPSTRSTIGGPLSPTSPGSHGARSPLVSGGGTPRVLSRRSLGGTSGLSPLGEFRTAPLLVVSL